MSQMKTRGKKKLKLFDRYLGIPLVFLLGITKKKKQLPQKIKSVGILLTPAIGDTILIGAPLTELKQKLKPDQIIFFVPDENKEAAEIIDVADKIITINLFRLPETIKKIRRFSFDVFIDSAQWARINSLLTFFSKSKYKIGFDTQRQYRKYVYDSTAEHSDKVHEIENYRKLISFAGINSNAMPAINIHSEIDPQKISIHLKPGGYLSYLKQWPKQNWIEVVQYFISRKFNVFFTGSSFDVSDIDEFINNFPNKNNLFNIAGKFTLSETAVHLKSSMLVISVNTGIMHIASAVGANLIALHGPTNPRRWGPLNENSISIQSNYPSAPCLNLGFEYNCDDRTGECMKAIQVSEVLKEIFFFLDENKINPNN